MILLELGNTTLKVARVAQDGAILVERFSNLEALLRRLEQTDEPIVGARVGGALAQNVIERIEERREIRLLTRHDTAMFVGTSYDTPETLGIDRILNLLGMVDDGIVVSSGTAVTIDAVAGGRPYWGAIMPGFRTAADGLHARVPALPLVVPTVTINMPARTSIDSVTNGIMMSTAFGARAIVARLGADVFPEISPAIVLTGGDAQLLSALWGDSAVAVDEALLFRGMLRCIDGS